MSTRNIPLKASAQRGVVLISAMLLLIVMTIFALTMFRSLGIQEIIAGGTREKQRALQTAIDAEQYAEIWLTTSGNALSNSYTCSGLTAYSSSSVPLICNAQLTSAISVPWGGSSSEVGFTFFPGSTSATTGDMTISSAGGVNTYVQVPRFYISLYSAATGSNQAVYKIDAWNWAGTSNTTAVVESTYQITASAKDLGGL